MLLSIFCEKAESLVWLFFGVSLHASAEIVHKQCQRMLHIPGHIWPVIKMSRVWILVTALVHEGVGFFIFKCLSVEDSLMRLNSPGGNFS